jgi:hypothetical protein
MCERLPGRRERSREKKTTEQQTKERSKEMVLLSDPVE